MRILIADDHPVVRRGLREIVASEHDMVVWVRRGGDEALDMTRRPRVGCRRARLRDARCSGAELVREVKRQYPGRPVLVLSILPEEVHAGEVFKAAGPGTHKGSANEDLTSAIRKVVAGVVCKPWPSRSSLLPGSPRAERSRRTTCSPIANTE